MTRDPDLTGRGYQRRYALPPAPGAVPRHTPDVIAGPWSAWKGKFGEPVSMPADLGTWLLFAPGAHPLWSWHAVMMCSLRDFPGVPPAKLQAPGNTHEIIVAALDPDFDPGDHIDALEKTRAKLLRPMNLVHQVSGLTDDQAVELLHLLVRAFVNGHSSPDDDFRTANIQMITATADHLRRGLHMPS